MYASLLLCTVQVKSHGQGYARQVALPDSDDLHFVPILCLYTVLTALFLILKGG